MDQWSGAAADSPAATARPGTLAAMTLHRADSRFPAVHRIEQHDALRQRITIAY